MVDVYYHDQSLDHHVMAGHPECPERYQSLKQALVLSPQAHVNPCLSSLGDEALAILAHDVDYIDGLKQPVADDGFVRIDADTVMSSGSWLAVLYALGAARTAVDQALGDPNNRAFLMHRPPGHHAEINRAMGFCFVNTAAVAARYALAQGLNRVAIVDFDVHHGNGTQDIFWNDSRVGYFSSHEMPLFPGTGASDEQGVGNIYNFPLPTGSDGTHMAEVYREGLLPQLENFAPELLVFSAGFDAHEQDPLASLLWKEDDFAWLTEACLKATAQSSQGRAISILEGGYNLDSLVSSAKSHVLSLAVV